MTLKNPLLVPELQELIAAGDAQALKTFCKTGHPAVVAELISALPGKDAWAVLRHADFPLRSEIFSHMDEDLQIEIIGSLQRMDIARLLSDMPPDNRADLFKELPEEMQESVLPALAQAEREDIRRLTAYAEGTAGAVMTSDYATLPPHLTASQAIDHLRKVAPDKETIYSAYVVDEGRRLQGFVSLKELIIARKDALIKDIMHPEVIFARVGDDQEEAARKIQKYDLLALPIINGGDTLVGIITHDDALDIITQEQTEDMEKLMAIAGSHEAGVYMKTSAWEHLRNRSPWIVMLAFLGMVSGYIVQSYEGLLLQFAILATFMPMLADTGGNTGSQAAALIIRALALKEVSPRDILGILFKEFHVAFVLALMLGLVAFGRVFFFGGNSASAGSHSLLTIGFAIAIALGLQVISATMIGVLLPMFAALLKKDPAVIASPALTTIVDITGLLIFFTTIKLMLGI
ncbi:MAG: magnesium transporter [Thermodesulfobacteriota bacterium]